MEKLIKENYIIKVIEKGIMPYNPPAFGVHANNGSCFKIYIVKDKTDILYVGMAKQKISARFSSSFRAYSKKKENGVSQYNGYSGYKWIEKFYTSDKEIKLIVFPFIDRDKLFIEAVEAEIVFLIRNNPPFKWPLSQHEIHFHNLKGAKEIALKIYNDIK